MCGLVLTAKMSGDLTVGRINTKCKHQPRAAGKHPLCLEETCQTLHLIPPVFQQSGLIQTQPHLKLRLQNIM